MHWMHLSFYTVYFFLETFTNMLFAVVSIVCNILASALWNRLGHFAVHPTSDRLCFTLIISFLHKRDGSHYTKAQEVKQWKLNISQGGMVLEQPYCTSVYFENLRGHIHCLCCVNVLLYIVHSSKKQQCSVTSCCIPGLSKDISCDVQITSRAQALFSASSMRQVRGFFRIIDQCVCL